MNWTALPLDLIGTVAENFASGTQVAEAVRSLAQFGLTYLS